MGGEGNAEKGVQKEKQHETRANKLRKKQITTLYASASKHKKKDSNELQKEKKFLPLQANEPPLRKKHTARSFSPLNSDPMPIFSPYFPLESNAYRVGNSGKLRRKMGCAGFGLYVMVLSHLRDCPNFTTALDYEALAFEFQESETSLRHVVEDFDLFLIDREAGTFTASVLQDMSDLVSRRRPWRRSDEERPRRVSKRTARCADDEGEDEASEAGSATETDADDNATAESTHCATDAKDTPEALGEHESPSPQNAADAAERKEKNKRPSPPIVPLPRGSGRSATPTREEAEADAILSLRQSEMPAAAKHALDAAQKKHSPASKNESTAAEEATRPRETTSARPSDGAPAKDKSRHFEPLKNELHTSLQTYDYDDESLLPQPPKNSPIAPSTADERAGAHRLVPLADGNPSSAAAAARRNRAAELRECVLALSAYDAGRVDF